MECECATAVAVYDNPRKYWHQHHMHGNIVGGTLYKLHFGGNFFPPQNQEICGLRNEQLSRTSSHEQLRSHLIM